MIPEKPLPKTLHSYCGSLHLERKRCGKRGCRCEDGTSLHGPYAVLRWREKGAQKKRYVPMHKVAETLIEIEKSRHEREANRALWCSVRRG